jgi:hypothetical protein
MGYEISTSGEGAVYGAWCMVYEMSICGERANVWCMVYGEWCIEYEMSTCGERA